MEISELQKIAADFRKSLDIKTGKQLKNGRDHMVDLMEEVGELAKSINRKEIRGVEPEHSIESEIIDVFLDILWMANHYNVDLGAGFMKSLEEWKKRFGIEIKER